MVSVGPFCFPISCRTLDVSVKRRYASSRHRDVDQTRTPLRIVGARYRNGMLPSRSNASMKPAAIRPFRHGHKHERASMPLSNNSIESQWIPIGAVQPYARHARTHSKRAIEKIKKLIGHYGQLVPIIVDQNNVIIDGHAVWRAMTELGSSDIAVVVVAGRSDI